MCASTCCTPRFRERNKELVEIITALISMTVCVIVIWLSWSYVAYSWNIGEGSANPGGIPARYLLKALIPIGFTLLLLQSVAQAIHSYYAWRSAA